MYMYSLGRWRKDRTTVRYYPEIQTFLKEQHEQTTRVTFHQGELITDVQIRSGDTGCVLLEGIMNYNDQSQ